MLHFQCLFRSEILSCFFGVHWFVFFWLVLCFCYVLFEKLIFDRLKHQNLSIVTYKIRLVCVLVSEKKRNVIWKSFEMNSTNLNEVNVFEMPQMIARLYTISIWERVLFGILLSWLSLPYSSLFVGVVVIVIIVDGCVLMWHNFNGLLKLFLKISARDCHSFDVSACFCLQSENVQWVCVYAMDAKAHQQQFFFFF